MRGIGRWLVDWKNWATAAACVLVALIAFTLVRAVESRDRAFNLAEDALAAQRESREAASRRIDLLQDQIADLISQAEHNAEIIGGLRQDVRALRRQIRQLGGEPVAGGSVDAPATGVSGGADGRSSTRSDKPRDNDPPDRPRPKPSEPSEPPPDEDVCLVGRCVDVPLLSR